MATQHLNGDVLETRILPVNTQDLGRFKDPKTLEIWELPTDEESLKPLQQAAQQLKSTNIPVGFPTETVYGLGADATNSDAVKGIYKAKGRPSDNPLIIHVCDLTMLRSLITPHDKSNGNTESADPIPAIYKPLIERFWPGPLTILLQKPEHCPLAPEVTAGLPTFGARMPASPLALSLIHLSGVPLAAPSANASTKPSPTTAQHVLHDLKGRIEIILDGGACQVGVESTVVDGLCSPPVVLRPGGVSMDLLRECPGWERVVRGYKDQSEVGDKGVAPRAPGMKYKHYSPKAKVILFEASAIGKSPATMIIEQVDKLTRLTFAPGSEDLQHPPKFGVVRTKYWPPSLGLEYMVASDGKEMTYSLRNTRFLRSLNAFDMESGEIDKNGIHSADVISISLGKDVKDIAHGLFSTLRELDDRGVDIIYVEGIKDEGDIAAAVMNRLRKAATVIEK